MCWENERAVGVVARPRKARDFMEKLQFSEIQLTHFVEKVLKGYMVEGGLQKRERFLAEGLLWVDSRMEKPFGKDEIRVKSEGAKHVFI